MMFFLTDILDCGGLSDGVYIYIYIAVRATVKSISLGSAQYSGER